MSPGLFVLMMGTAMALLSQMMSAPGIVYTLVVAPLLGNSPVQPDLSKGLAALWNPFVILFYQLIWWALFIYHGCSKVTSSEISFRIEPDRLRRN